MGIGDRWSVRRLAHTVGVPATSLQRLLDDLSLEGVVVAEWEFDRAVIGVKAYREGHTQEAIALLGRQPHIGSTSWLVSGVGSAEIFSNLLQATAYIDTHPHGTYHLSPIGFMSSQTAA